jgi:hypothetical protein
MREYEIVDTDADNIGACCLCGYKPGRTEGHRRRCDWLKQRYAEGLRYKVLRSRVFGDIGMIEYAPGSHAWRPVEAEGYLVIHCLIVDRERVLKRHGKGLTILAADQCPAVPKWVEEIAEASMALGLHPKVVRVRSAKVSRELPTPYGMFSIIYDGRLIVERPVSAARFTNIMSKLTSSRPPAGTSQRSRRAGGVPTFGDG